MFFHMVYKSGQIFLPFCHNSRVWRTDRQTDGRTDRILIARPRLHSMQRGNKIGLRLSVCDNCKKNLVQDTVWRPDLWNSRDHFAMSQGLVPFLYCDLYMRAHSEKTVWAVITSVTTRRTHWYNQLQLHRADAVLSWVINRSQIISL